MTVTPENVAPGCPDVASIERMAAGEDLGPDVGRHVESCPSCRSRLTAAREDAAFTGRARALVADDLGPAGAPRVPGYRVLGIVGGGAQGVVYRAVQESTSRTVAIKTLAAGVTGSTRQRHRAEREVEIIARLRHPNIVDVFESRTLWDGRIALVMEYVDGVPLDAWRPGGETSIDRQRDVLRLFIAVCNGVHHAHLNGVIHRDLKPENILVTKDDDGAPRPVVVDFGIAKAAGVHATLTGEFAGTPAYASPEQVAGRPEDVDALTDVYSLGVILYRLLCGALPYDVGESIFEAARTIAEVEPVPPRTRNAVIPADLEAIVLRALRKDKHRRYQSAAGLARDLERFLKGEPVEARSESGWYLLRKAVMVNRGRLAVVAIAALLVIAAGIAVVISLASARESARLAELRQEQARAEHVHARAVTELLREALPNPEGERPEFGTLIAQGLNRLYYRLETGGFADDPAVDQEIRRLWGGVYTGFGGKAPALVEYAEISLRNGLVRMRQDPKPPNSQPTEIARTQGQLAAVLLVRRRYPEAESFCREALDAHERISGAQSLEAGEARALLARILLAKGEAAGALREADRALAIFQPLPARDAELPIAGMLALKARLRLDARDAAGAEPLVRDALERRFRVLPPDDPELLTSLNDAADLADLAPKSALGAMVCAAWRGSGESPGAAVRRDIPIIRAPNKGDFRNPVRNGRTEALSRMLALQESLVGMDDPSLVGTLLAQVRSAQAEVYLETRAEGAIRAAAILSKRFGPRDFAVVLCLQEAAVAQVFAGHFERAIELSRRSCEVWDSIPRSARDPLMTANAHRYLAWFIALAGRYEEGEAESQRALDMFAACVGPEHHAVAFCESLVAYCELMTGKPGADDHSRHALELAVASPATPIDQLSNAHFVRACVLLAQNKHADARTHFQAAWDQYFHFLDPTYPWQQVLVRGMVQCSQAAGDSAAVAEWKTRQLPPATSK